jgi:hypothetical protein
MSLYFNRVTNQIWGEGPSGPSSEPDSEMDAETDRLGEDPPTEDFGDDEINAAARLVGTVSLL